MPWYRMPFHQGGGGDLFHLNLGRARNKKAASPCCVCGWIPGRECDWVIAPGKTCDLPLCAHCSFSPAFEKDLCPHHVGLFKAWCAGRTNTTDGAG